MIIAVIGGEGVVGKALCEFFESLRHKVIRVDPKLEAGLTIEEAASQADVVFVVVLPIEATAGVIRQATSEMKPGTLLLHGTSIENPIGAGAIDAKFVASRGIVLGHLHFHFRPQLPLSTTLRGQKITVHLARGKGSKRWREWITTEFGQYDPQLIWLGSGQHDQLTSVSQLIHMLVSVIVGLVWTRLPKKTVRDGVTIGGPPCQLLVRMLLRVGGAPQVVASILVNHPRTLQILRLIEQAAAKVRQAVESHDTAWLVGIMTAGRSMLSSPMLTEVDETTTMLARLEADMRHAHYTFKFTPAENVPGLLEQVAREFRLRGVNLASNVDYDTPDGGCVFIMSVGSKNAAAEAAAEAVQLRSWTPE